MRYQRREGSRCSDAPAYGQDCRSDDDDGEAEDVGFYYAANALGRFIGTLLSGLLYQWGGLLYALVGSAVMLVLCWLVTLGLPTTRADAQGVAA